MPPAIGGLFAAYWLAVGVTVLVVAGGYLLYTQLNKAFAVGDFPKYDEKTSRGHQVNTREAQKVLPLIYGRIKVGINIVYIGVTGTDNKYLHIIGTVCEGPINGIATEDAIEQVFLNDKLYNDPSYEDTVSYTFYTGTSSQNVCALHDVISEWNDPLRYTAYIYIKLKYDQDIYQGVPNITIEVEGLKVYNPATDTTEYSTNPVLHARDMMIRSSRRGGMEISSSRINDTTVISAAAYCTTKGWTCGTVFIENNSIIDNLQSILACYRGMIIFSGNEFKFVYKDMNYESAVMALTENDVVGAGVSSINITQPSIFNTPNSIRAKYYDSEKKYQLTDYVFTDSTSVTSDGDLRETTIALNGINDLSKVIKMCSYHLEKLRINKKVSLTAGPRCAALEVGDLITLTHSMPGWISKYFRVTSMSMSSDGNIALEIEEEDSRMYNDVYDLSAHSWVDTTLPRPTDAVWAVINVTHEEEVYYYRERSFTRWKIDFDPPATEDYPWWSYAEIWIKVDEDGDWKFQTTATTDFVLDPVEEGRRYYCKIRSVSIYGVKEDIDTAVVISKFIVGKTAAPTDISSLTAVATNDAVNIYATKVDEADIAGYEVRLGSSWNGGLFIGFNETPNIRLIGVRPGTHTFMMAPKGNNGIYGADPKSATVVVPYPVGYTSLESFTWEFNLRGDIHDNTEQIWYNDIRHLKCSHGCE